jgi:hypothetical protein
MGVRLNVHASAICHAIIFTPGQLIQHLGYAKTKRKTPNSRLTQWLRNTRFHALDLGRAEAGESALVLGTTKSRTDRTLEIRNGSSDGGSALTTGLSWLR